MAWLKVAGWQLPHLRGKQVFLAPCLGGYGTGLINHGEQYPVLFSASSPPPTPVLVLMAQPGTAAAELETAQSCGSPHVVLTRPAGGRPSSRSPQLGLPLPHCCLLPHSKVQVSFGSSSPFPTLHPSSRTFSPVLSLHVSSSPKLHLTNASFC